MKTQKLVLIGIVMLLSTSVFAQGKDSRFSFELNTGPAFSVSDLNNSQLNPGFGFESIFHYRFLPHTSVYAGWGWNRIAANESFAGSDICFEETGYIMGLQFMHPISDSRFSWYLRAAALYNHIETENADGDIISDSKHGFGYQLGCGVAYRLSRNWQLTAGMKFNSLTRDSQFEGTAKILEYKYISGIRMGFVKQF
ncbi:MAG: outer membrane beta-barrel protein [Bacteroidales bacterium]|jgi:hypothetical protein|nr:outer membrane beta-barrel protein [Bacteroidales bacterium]